MYQGNSVETDLNKIIEIRVEDGVQFAYFKKGKTPASNLHHRER
jgi:hypothetical protein